MPSEMVNTKGKNPMDPLNERTLSAIQEWLADYKMIPDEQLFTFSEIQRTNTELRGALQKLFNELYDEIIIMEPVCHQLFEFFRSNERNLKRFTLELLPNMMYYSLRSHDHLTKAGAVVEACLLGMYNLETVDTNCEAKVTSFRIPTLAQSSMYHEPVRISSLALTETALSKFANKESEVWRGGPYQQYETFNVQCRDAVFSLLQQSYNADIANLSASSHQAFCNICYSISASGFTGYVERIVSVADGYRDTPRISVSPALLVEMLSGVYFCLYNGVMYEAKEALEAIHRRACYELYSDVQLVTNAIRNSLRNSSANESDAVGLSIHLNQSSSLLKTAITNASFKAQKLPDDIPMSESVAEKLKQLPMIEEKPPPPRKLQSGLSPVKGKFVKFVVRQGEKLKGKKDPDPAGTSQNLNTNNPEEMDILDSLPLSVMVERKNSQSLVDTVELSNVNPIIPSEGEDQPIVKPRSASMTTPTSQATHKPIVSRLSTNNISASSIHTQI